MAATILSPAARPLTDVPAALDALIRVRAAAADLERAELAAIDAARAGGATWQQIAAALGMRGRTGAHKRYTDLTRRLSAPRPSERPASAATPGPGTAPPPAVVAEPPTGRPPTVDMPRDDTGHDTLPAGRQEPVTPPAGQEPAASGHRPVPEIGPEWTITQPSGPGGDVVLWRDGVRVGTAGRAGFTRAWTSTRDSGGTVTGLGAPGRYSTRIKALMALAVDHEAARRRLRPGAQTSRHRAPSLSGRRSTQQDARPGRIRTGVSVPGGLGRRLIAVPAGGLAGPRVGARPGAGCRFRPPRLVRVALVTFAVALRRLGPTSSAWSS